MDAPWYYILSQPGADGVPPGTIIGVAQEWNPNRPAAAKPGTLHSRTLTRDAIQLHAYQLPSRAALFRGQSGPSLTRIGCPEDFMAEESEKWTSAANKTPLLLNRPEPGSAKPNLVGTLARDERFAWHLSLLEERPPKWATTSTEAKKTWLRTPSSIPDEISSIYK